MNESERALCGTCAARLEGQLQLAWLAVAMTAAALLAGALSATVAWCGVVLFGLMERYVAVRIAVDARLFAQLAAQPLTLAHLDEALGQLGMMAKDKRGRPLSDRIEGARAWAQRHTVLVVVQVLSAAVVMGYPR
jgi:hypothetical protein